MGGLIFTGILFVVSVVVWGWVVFSDGAESIGNSIVDFYESLGFPLVRKLFVFKPWALKAFVTLYTVGAAYAFMALTLKSCSG